MLMTSKLRAPSIQDLLSLLDVYVSRVWLSDFSLGGAVELEGRNGEITRKRDGSQLYTELNRVHGWRKKLLLFKSWSKSKLPLPRTDLTTGSIQLVEVVRIDCESMGRVKASCFPWWGVWAIIARLDAWWELWLVDDRVFLLSCVPLHHSGS